MDDGRARTQRAICQRHRRRTGPCFHLDVMTLERKWTNTGWTATMIPCRFSAAALTDIFKYYVTVTFAPYHFF